jgi:toxin ParE1/3/4
VPGIVVLPFVDEQIVDALVFTHHRFGARKAQDYRGLIADAFAALEADPRAGVRRPDVHPEAWTYHIAQRGRRGRHLFLYRVRETAEIARFLHDVMDYARHWPDEDEWHQR